MQPTSNASHKILRFSSIWFDKKTCKKARFRKLSNGGCGLTGRKVIRTRGRLLRRLQLPKIAYRFRLTYPLLVSTFKVTPFYSKIVSLAVLPSGGVCYLPTLERHPIFSVVHLQTPLSSSWIKREFACLTLVSIVQQYRRISNFEIWPGKGIQYARSAGSWGKITSRDFKSHTAVAYLPSGVRKIVSIFSTIVPGRSAGIDKRVIKNTKSGYWRSFGFKPTVRGVAMNPVDHPHGGRTKAIRYPRTPWGKTTKFK